MSLQSLQGPADLAGKLLRINFLALDGGHSPELGLRFGEPSLAPLLVALLPPRAASNHIAFAFLDNFHHFGSVP